ncbi:acetyltransferase [uncultured Treponema sp.]|uniref:acetyltransferase n=1 Tax=uncultured Treponema sp. TaxID=162155 RepID=UPI0025EB485E|nr:acetyltransferase [uncultured Treponema sp.]
MENNKSIIIIGAGDHSKILLDILLMQNVNVIGLTDKFLPLGIRIYNIPIIGTDDCILRYSAEEILLVNGIGSIGNMSLRRKIYKRFSALGYKFMSVIHPSAVISSRSVLNEGVQVLAGTIINAEAFIGENTIINTKTSVDHGCVIGRNVHIAPGCTLSGCVKIGDNVHIGTGSSIIQGIKIGDDALIGAGSVVVNDIQSNSKAYGVPAKIKSIINTNGGRDSLAYYISRRLEYGWRRRCA